MRFAIAEAEGINGAPAASGIDPGTALRES
jgi:hypothetical protein